MFKCKYKFELEDSIVSAKYVYKSQKRKKDKIITLLIPALLIAMIVMLVVDIRSGNAIGWDITLIVALLILEAVHIILPYTVVSSQKKSFRKQQLESMDYLLVEINDNICTETMVKNEDVVAKSMHNLRSLTSYVEDAYRIVLIFNNVEYVCIRKAYLEGGVVQLKAHLEKRMAKYSKK